MEKEREGWKEGSRGGGRQGKGDTHGLGRVRELGREQKGRVDEGGVSERRGGRGKIIILAATMIGYYQLQKGGNRHDILDTLSPCKPKLRVSCRGSHLML